jgi:hypothetical protein
MYLTLAAVTKLNFQIFVKTFFEKYLQVVNAFNRIVKNHRFFSPDNNARQIFDRENRDLVISPVNLTAKLQMRRVRIAQRKTIHFHYVNDVQMLVRGNHIPVMISAR